MAMRPAVLCLGPSGREVSAKVADAVRGDLLTRDGGDGEAFEDIAETARALFLAGRPLIGVFAAGIMIRLLASVLGDKHSEPPVLVVSDDGETVVPLLGGHRGANRMAAELARSLGGTPAVTTAGDIRFGVALDDPPPGWRLANSHRVKSVASALLAGDGIVLEGEEAGSAGWLDPLPRAQDPKSAQRIVVSMEPAVGDDEALRFVPTRIALGVGCSRHCPPGELADLAQSALSEVDLDRMAIAGMFSLDLKADEPAVLELAETWNLPLRFFPADLLETETPRLHTPSDQVFAEVGCHGVAEAAALAGAGPDATLLSAKRKSEHATCALAVSPDPIARLAGRKRGSVRLISAGPGQASWRAPEASVMAASADELVGYGPYLDLLGPLVTGVARKVFPMGREEERCRYALERAGEGLDVALVCSGDAGIYAMGALVYELLARSPEEGGVSAQARRVAVVSSPGVSAFQAAAIRAGAPVGHDFCAISLSDLLTPRETILRRIEAAAAGDFVIALYNPVSTRRRELLDMARDILLKSRSADTPVFLGTNLGRPGETFAHRTLETLRTDEIDMLTVVLVGSSQSRRIETADGPRMFTPRGYAVRIEEKLKRRRA